MTSLLSKTIRHRQDDLCSPVFRFVLAITGILLAISVQFVGEIYIGEIALGLLLAGYLITRPTMIDRWPGYVKLLGLTLALSFIGYVVTDYIVGTEAHNLLRGWGREILIVVDILGAYLLTKGSGTRLIWLTIGYSASNLAVALLDLNRHSFLESWKLYIGYPFTILIVSVLLQGKLSRRFAPVALLVLGVVHVLLDCRSMGSGCILIACLQLSRGSQRRRWSLISYAITLVVLAVGAALVTYVYISGSAKFAQRRAESNNERVAGIVISIQEIARSPFIGHGSWSVLDDAAMDVFKGTIREAGIKKMAGGETQSVGAHSQILQAWFEGGILALAFPVYFGILLVKGIRAFRREAVAQLPSALLVRLFLLNSAWSLLFSPLSGIHRIYMALSVAAISVVLKVPVARAGRSWPKYGRYYRSSTSNWVPSGGSRLPA